MATVIQHEELVRRALRYIVETMQEKSGPSLDSLLDEAGARFNLSPRDQLALEHLLQAHLKGNDA